MREMASADCCLPVPVLAISYAISWAVKAQVDDRHRLPGECAVIDVIRRGEHVRVLAA